MHAVDRQHHPGQDHLVVARQPRTAGMDADDLLVLGPDFHHGFEVGRLERLVERGLRVLRRREGCLFRERLFRSCEGTLCQSFSQPRMTMRPQGLTRRREFPLLLIKRPERQGISKSSLVLLVLGVLVVCAGTAFLAYRFGQQYGQPSFGFSAPLPPER